jgi:hypothetical protein
MLVGMDQSTRTRFASSDQADEARHFSMHRHHRRGYYLRLMRPEYRFIEPRLAVRAVHNDPWK